MINRLPNERHERRRNLALLLESHLIPQASGRVTVLMIEDCIRNVRTNAPEAQSWLATRFSMGEKRFYLFVTESRKDCVRILFMQEPIDPTAKKCSRKHPE